MLITSIGLAKAFGMPTKSTLQVMLTLNLINFFLFYFHERIWNRIR
jgi:uncharacterized membrane protein